MTGAPGKPLAIAMMLETDGPGGAERMVLHLATTLRRRGHRVLPVLPDNGSGWLAGQFRALGIEAVSFSLRRPVDLRCLAALVRVLHRQEIDVVHSHDFTMAVYGGASAALSRARHVITMHGNRYFAARWRRRVALRWACRRSQGVVAVSEATQRELASTLRLPADAVSVIRNGVALQSGDPTALRNELRLEPHELLIVAIGNVMAVKGHIVLLRALSGLQARRPDLRWRVAIAGRERDQAAALRSHAQEHGFGDRLHLLGYRADVADILAAADLYVMPSLSEGTPLALLEAMLAGKAVIASAVGGVPEVMTDRGDGLLTPPGDVQAFGEALEQLLSDAARRASLGEAARRRATRDFGVDAMVDAYTRLYGVGPLPQASSRIARSAAPLYGRRGA